LHSLHNNDIPFDDQGCFAFFFNQFANTCDTGAAPILPTSP
jgi:hypothetical protein